MEVYHLDKQSASYILSMAAVGMILGSPLLSFLSDRIFKRRKAVLIGSSLMMILTSIPLTFFTGSLNLPLLYVICLNIGLFSGAIVTIAFTATKELFPNRYRRDFHRYGQPLSFFRRRRLSAGYGSSIGKSREGWGILYLGRLSIRFSDLFFQRPGGLFRYTGDEGNLFLQVIIWKIRSPHLPGLEPDWKDFFLQAIAQGRKRRFAGARELNQNLDFLYKNWEIKTA